ncbi:MAG: signal peptide peptidase SppA, partial [Verrucomicrobiae bacterium]
SDVLYDAICRLARHKPVVVYFNSIGASGAYYAACGSNWIMCNNTTFTGSIGVVISTLNYRDLFGKIGLQSVVFKSGKFKDMLNGAREMSPEEKEYVQGLVMQSYDRFVGIVARSRKLEEKTLREGVADGRILSGTDAYASKLVDELGYIEDAYNKAAELGKVPGAEIVKYERNFSFEKFFRLFGESRAATKIEFAMLPKTLRLEPGRVYLLPAFFAP